MLWKETRSTNWQNDLTTGK